MGFYATKTVSLRLDEKRPKSTLFNKYKLLFKIKNMGDDFHFECGLKIIKTINCFFRIYSVNLVTGIFIRTQS